MTEKIPEKMKAARVTEFGKSEYEIQDIPVPKPKGYEVLIKIGAAGFCHTDAMVYDGQFESMGSKCPITGSHEPAGTIVAMGPDAEKLGKQKVGDRIGAENMMGPCGKCPDCTVHKDPTYCPNLEGMAGITKDGGFAEYCLLDARTAAKLPDEMSFEQAAPLMCAGVTIYSAIKKAEACGLKEGGTIGFSGLGALGHLGVQFAICMGYKVVGIDARPEPIDLAKSLKYPPDLVLDATKIKAEDALPKVKELDPTKPFEGLDAVILLADPQSSFDYAVALTARHGLVVLVSQPEKGINLQFFDVIFRDIRLVGSLLGKQQYLQETVDLCAKHGIESHIAAYKLDDINKMVKDNHSDKKKGKTVITFS
ncbi:alcohol dehydrogenase [Cystobasidium minutum MCA 4210]|uniref:alcohol dehydrogenase n=1 Tax=Cystobasidium minutum MCA 4210 TaxID=1397322 RepID=UPI0034CF0E5F|eukprot:jgi/Rhomi1/164929/fgenesh1_kg.1_\